MATAALLVGACGSEVIVEGPAPDDDDTPIAMPGPSTGTGTSSGTSTGTSSGTSTGTSSGTGTGTGTGGSGKLCGGGQPPCPPADFCDFPGETCAGQGTCTARPTACDEDCPGVCGCDGLAYCNVCLAQASGSDVSSAIDCP